MEKFLARSEDSELNDNVYCNGNALHDGVESERGPKRRERTKKAIFAEVTAAVKTNTSVLSYFLGFNLFYLQKIK